MPTSSWELLLWAGDCLSQTLESLGGVRRLSFLTGRSGCDWRLYWGTRKIHHSCSPSWGSQDGLGAKNLGTAARLPTSDPRSTTYWLVTSACFLCIFPHPKTGPRSEFVGRRCLSEYMGKGEVISSAEEGTSGGLGWPCYGVQDDDMCASGSRSL